MGEVGILRSTRSIMRGVILMGRIDGIVVWPDGKPCTSGARIRAELTGFWDGGMTNNVYSDSRGYFTLIWSGDNKVKTLYCEGKEVERDLPSNASNVRITMR